MDTPETKQKRVERKRQRLEYLASLLRRQGASGLDALATTLCNLTDAEVVVLVDKLRLWLV
jgi:hypothetical protein